MLALCHFELYLAKLCSELLKLVRLAFSLQTSFPQATFLLIWCDGMQWLGLHVQAPNGKWGVASFTERRNWSQNKPAVVTVQSEHPWMLTEPLNSPNR